jgi:hypothetical protein
MSCLKLLTELLHGWLRTNTNLADIRTRNISDTSTERYCYATLLGVMMRVSGDRVSGENGPQRAKFHMRQFDIELYFCLLRSLCARSKNISEVVMTQVSLTSQRNNDSFRKVR